MKFVLLLHMALLLAACNRFPGDTTETETERGADSFIDQKKIAEENYYSRGESLFKANCAPCHGVNRTIVGPPLTGVTSKRDQQWIIQFVRNSKEMINVKKDTAAISIYEKFNRAEQPSFSNLSDSAILSIFYYVDHYHVKTPVPIVVN